MRNLLVAVLFPCMLAVFVPGPSTAQEGGVDFVVEPVPGSSTAPTGGYFLIEATPGQNVTEAIGIRNDSSGRLELRLAAVDAVTGQLGGVSYGLDTETPIRTGAWITLERTSLALEPGASAVVRFQVVVPGDAGSGEHLAGISVTSPTRRDGGGAAGEGRAGASIDVQTRRIVAVQLNLPGPSDPELVVTGVSPAARPDGLYLEITIENRGRGLTRGHGRIALPGQDFDRTFTVDTFVPGTSTAYPIKWTEDPSDGEYEARVELRYGERVATWNGSLAVGQPVLEELAERQVEAPDNEGGQSPPLAALAGAALAGAALIAAGGRVMSRIRNRASRHPGRSQGPD